MKKETSVFVMKNLKTIRKKRNLSLAKMGLKVKKAPAQIHNWEKGKNAKLSTVQQIASLLDVSVDELLGNKTLKRSTNDYSEAAVQRISTEVLVKILHDRGWDVDLILRG